MTVTLLKEQETKPENPPTESAPSTTPANSNKDNLQQQKEEANLEVPESAILVACHSSEQQSSPDILPVFTQAPVPQLLGNLIEKGVAKKFYLPITLEHHIKLEALVDMGADITLKSTPLLEEIQEATRGTNRTLRPQKCALNAQAYSHTGLQLELVAPIHLTVGPMSLVHPVYISPLDTYPLLIGNDLLNRFVPIIDFKHLKMWAQVREPLPFQPYSFTAAQCQATDSASLAHSEDDQTIHASFELRLLHTILHMLRLKDDILIYAPDDLTTPKHVTPRDKGG